MLDLRRDARLALEARAKRRVVREVGRDDLQRDDPVGPLLAGAVDDAHAPAARDGLDDEAVDLRARPQQRAAHAGSLDDAPAPMSDRSAGPARLSSSRGRRIGAAPPRLRARSSVGERSLHTREVAGSKPAAPMTDE